MQFGDVAMQRLYMLIYTLIGQWRKISWMAGYPKAIKYTTG